MSDLFGNHIVVFFHETAQMLQEHSFSLGPSPAKKLKEERGSSQLEHTCIICWKRDRNLVNPKEGGKQKLFSSLTKCCDSVFYRIKSNNGLKSDDEGNIFGFSDISVR